MELGDLGRLVLGEDLGEHLVDAEVGADGVGHLAGVAGDHHHSTAHLPELVDGLAGLGADLVLEGQGADDVGALHQVEDGGAALPPSARRAGEVGGFTELALPEQHRAPDGVGGSVDGGSHAPAGDGAEPAGLGHIATFVGGGDDGPGQGVLAVGLDRPGDAEDVALGVPGGGRHADDDVLALGQGAGLVEQDGIDGAAGLQREAVLDEDAVPGGHGARQGGGQGDGQAQGVGAGDHQHGDHPNDGFVAVAQCRPDDGRDDCGAHGHVEEEGGGPIGQHLGAGLRCLGLGDQPADPGQGGVVSHRGDLNPDGRVGGHGAGHHLVPDRLGDGAGLAGDHGLVELGFSVDDLPVGGHPSTGAHQHGVSGAEGTGRDGLEGTVGADALGLVGEKGGQGGQGVLGLAEGLHLLPVSEQHDRDQRSELPPEVEIEPVQRGGHRGPVGDRDGHGDQQHHAGLAVLGLLHPAGQERPAAPYEHEGAEHRPHPVDAVDVEVIAEPVHDHVTGHHQRDRQEETPPEPCAEHLDVVTGVLSLPALAARGGRVVGRLGVGSRGLDVLRSGVIVQGVVGGHGELLRSSAGAERPRSPRTASGRRQVRPSRRPRQRSGAGGRRTSRPPRSAGPWSMRRSGSGRRCSSGPARPSARCPAPAPRCAEAA